MARTSGFSLLELMIVLIIILSISAAIFQTINLTTQRSSAEQTKIDMFQEAREFMDQMSRDLRQAGYPSARNMDPVVFGVLTLTPPQPIINDHHVAAGIVKVDTGDLWFEGDLDGTEPPKVWAVRYHLDSSGPNCPCLKRSQLEKQDGDPLTGQLTEVYQVEVQGVLNTDIFSAYTNGTAVGLPVSTAVGSSLATVDTVQAKLTLQAATADPQTRQRPTATLVTTVRLNNCSQAGISFKTSCQ